MTSPAAGQRDSSSAVVFVLLLMLVCGWILVLPVFPSQDGPVHVYYADVAAQLLSGPTVFANGFRVAHALPPYSLHTYLLMAALHAVSPAMSEKLLACLCVLIAAVGFVYFAHQIGQASALVAVLAVPFFLHRYLFFGFFGYCMGVGLALLAMGIWSRQDRASWRRRTAFLLLAVLTAFTHPLPYGLLIAYSASEVIVAAALWRHAGQGSTVEFARPRWADAITLAVATLPLLYIARYADSGRLWTRYSAAELHGNLMRIFEFIEMYSVVPLDVTAYRAALRTVLLVLFALAFWKSAADMRAGRFTRAQLALAWGLLIMVSLPFLPGAVNGSAVFEQRVAIWPALLILLSACAIKLDARASQLALLAGVVIGVSALWVLNLHLGPVARQLDVSKRTAVATAGAHAVLINDSNPPPDLTFDPYIWAGVRVAEQEHAILINSPWLDLSIMMLKPADPELNQASFVSNPKLLVPKFGNSSMIVVVRCGDFGVRPSVTAGLRSTYARQWKFSQHTCFDMLQPAS